MKHLSSSPQLIMKLILLINVKMPTIVGILRSMSRINKEADSFKARNINFLHFNCYWQCKIHAHLSKEQFYNLRLGAGKRRGRETSPKHLFNRTGFLRIACKQHINLLHTSFQYLNKIPADQICLSLT